MKFSAPQSPSRHPHTGVGYCHGFTNCRGGASRASQGEPGASQGGVVGGVVQPSVSALRLARRAAAFTSWPVNLASRGKAIKTSMPISKSDPRLLQAGFAKLEGDDFSYTVRSYEVTLGRVSKTPVDVALGENMNVSRLHAKISYNFKMRQFELTVQGKNGVSVNTVLYIPASDPLPLRSRDHLTIGDKSFFFLLPRAVKSKRKSAPLPQPSPMEMDEDEDEDDEDEDTANGDLEQSPEKLASTGDYAGGSPAPAAVPTPPPPLSKLPITDDASSPAGAPKAPSVSVPVAAVQPPPPPALQPTPSSQTNEIKTPPAAKSPPAPAAGPSSPPKEASTPPPLCLTRVPTFTVAPSRHLAWLGYELET
eukprot:gene7661-815_t